MTFWIRTGLVAAAALAVLAAWAQTPDADGEVTKVDKSAGKVTLRHGPIKSLDMPPMTMVFRVADANLLETLQVGDRVRFAAEKRDGAYTLVTVQRAPR